MVLAEGLKLVIRRANHAVTHEENGRRADHLLLAETFDLVILDMSLPDMDGSEILRRLRHRGSKVPVLILTARDGLADRVQGLDLGADDYLVKPFEMAELEARVRMLLRRGQSGSSATLQLGKLSMDTVGRRAYLNDEILELSAREMSILEVLMLRANKVVSKDQLSAHLSDLGEEISVNAIEVHVHRLRKKIASDCIEIRTLYGQGYMLEKAD
jgi:two-component system OmpR family response regulator